LFKLPLLLLLHAAAVVVELVEQAVLAGFRGIDTACQPKHYREDLVGQALQRLEQVRQSAIHGCFLCMFEHAC
jgi:diketogulonate reductase-like aldo/keto reductase